MDISKILSAVDHTLLSQTATWDEIRALCDDGAAFGCATVCIPPCYVKRAVEYLNGRLPVCTVIGFPNGYNSTSVKCAEAAEAARDGAAEIDMVINLGMVKEGRYEDVLAEINAVCEACSRPVKVIIETCFLTEEEKVQLCKTVSESNARFIKTSTGFGGGGATFEDVELMAAQVTGGTLVKAAGGIRTLADAEHFLELGASRLGTSKIVKLAKEEIK